MDPKYVLIITIIIIILIIMMIIITIIIPPLSNKSPLISATPQNGVLIKNLTNLTVTKLKCM